MRKPLAIDLFTGLHGWGEGLVAEGYRVVGFDLEDMCGQFGHQRHPDIQLVLQDVLTIHGKQFKDAALIVASPPCQEYSYMAMPWSRAKAIAADYRSGKRDVKQLTALFDACFRIQREASEAAGHHVPLVVENVRGAIPWVGRSLWNFGSFHLWGDVPALMPMVAKHVKVASMGAGWYPPDHPKHVPGLAFNGHADRNLREGLKNPGFRFDGSGRSMQSESVDRHVREGLKWGDCPGKRFDDRPKGNVGMHREGQKTTGHLNKRNGHSHTRHLTNQDEHGVKHHGSGAIWFDTGPASKSSKSSARKAASAMIAKIPFVLSQHIARVYKPETAA